MTERSSFQDDRNQAGLFAIAVDHHQQGKWREAEQLYHRLLEAEPTHADALHNMGVLCSQTGRMSEAIRWMEQASRAAPERGDIQLHLAILFQEIGNIEQSLAAYERAARNLSFSAVQFNNLGNLYRRLGRTKDATKAFRQACALKPDWFEARNNLGWSLHESGESEAAIEMLHRALILEPHSAVAFHNLGTIYRDQGRFEMALHAFQRAIQLAPHQIESYINLGGVWRAGGELQQAANVFEAATRIEPDSSAAHFNLASVLQELAAYPSAISSYRRALELAPDCGLVALVHQLQLACEWTDIDAIAQRVRDTVDRPDFDSSFQVDPFLFVCLPIPTPPAQQLRCAQSYAQSVRQLVGPPRIHLPETRRQHGSKLRIGYLSSDLHPHPIAYLTAELFESHRREEFEIYGYSYGPDAPGPFRQRLERAFDHFREVRNQSHREIAERIAADEIDILVDIKGYTYQARSEIMAYRPAPIQVNYLGYCSTMGADFIDYIVVDDFVVPTSQQPNFSERLVHLPGSYYVHDSQLKAEPSRMTRSQAMLPDDAFVFCCFSGSQKITPTMFSLWMRLLAAKEGSLLWLLDAHPMTRDNLRREATKQGIAADRIVFAPRLPVTQHLARHPLADLFLDTFPYNAHTTAGDALRMGLPVVTLAGESFSSRVAGSLLRSLELSDLITYSPRDYESLSLELATEPEKLRAVRQRLAAILPEHPTFSGKVFARRLEEAYHRMWRNFLAGEKPQPIAIDRESNDA